MNLCFQQNKWILVNDNNKCMICIKHDKVQTKTLKYKNERVYVALKDHKGKVMMQVNVFQQ